MPSIKDDDDDDDDDVKRNSPMFKSSVFPLNSSMQSRLAIGAHNLREKEEKIEIDTISVTHHGV
jgi:mannitol-specific phosphotransferase system IIBC component